MCYRGQLFWYNFESKEGSSIQGGGARPCIVLSNNMACKHSPVIFVSPITSKFTKSKLPTHVVIGRESGLPKDSVALLEQIITIDKCKLGDYIGEVPIDKIYEIDRALIISGGIDIQKQQITNVIDRERINDLISSIKDTEEMIQIVNNDYFKKVKRLLLNELKNYCNQCGANFDYIIKSHNINLLDTNYDRISLAR